MKNEQLITKILKYIHYSNHILSKDIIIEDETYDELIKTNDNEWILCNNRWELPLKELTNRELIKLYQSL